MRGKHKAMTEMRSLLLLPDLIRAQTHRCCVRVVRFSYKRLYGSSDMVATMAKGRGRKPDGLHQGLRPARPSIIMRKQPTTQERIWADKWRRLSGALTQRILATSPTCQFCSTMPTPVPDVES